jgi:hypothetical protein
MDSIASSCNLNSFETERSKLRLPLSSLLRDSLAILSWRCALLYAVWRMSEEDNSSCRPNPGDIAALVPRLNFMRASISERKCCDAGISFHLMLMGKHAAAASVSLQKLMLRSSCYSIGTVIRSVLTIVNRDRLACSYCANDAQLFFLKASMVRLFSLCLMELTNLTSLLADTTLTPLLQAASSACKFVAMATRMHSCPPSETTSSDWILK